MEKSLLIILIIALALLSTGCAHYALNNPVETKLASQSEHSPLTETEQLLQSAECQRKIERISHTFGGPGFVINENDRKDLMNLCMMGRGDVLAAQQ